MSRVMHCIASLAVGGVESCVLDMFDFFLKHGSRHQHVLCAFRGGKLEESRVPGLREAGVECHVLRRRSRYSLSFCRDLRRTAAGVGADIIQAYNPTAALWARLLLGNRRQRLIVHCGGVGGLSRRWRTIERTLLTRADAFVFNSHSTRAVWESFLPIRCRRRVIYNGVTFPETGDATASGPASDSPFVLLTVCRVVPVKALHTQIDALRLLHDRGQADVRLLIVGDGPTRAQLQQRVARLNLGHAVTFEGYQPDPRIYHRRAHVYLCTSYNETFSMTLASAMFDSMICIAASAGGPSEIIEDGRCGFLVPCTQPLPDELRGRLPTGQALPAKVFDHSTGQVRPPLGLDPGALADKIIEVRERWDGLAAMRAAARTRIVENFSVERYCRALEALYDELGPVRNTASAPSDVAK